jgi:hypothetical protein
MRIVTHYKVMGGEEKAARAARTVAVAQKAKRRSEAISLRRKHFHEWAWEELNLRPHAYQASQKAFKIRHDDGLS